jgi:hypothetical protein
MKVLESAFMPKKRGIEGGKKGRRSIPREKKWEIKGE